MLVRLLRCTHAYKGHTEARTRLCDSKAEGRSAGEHADDGSADGSAADLAQRLQLDFEARLDYLARGGLCVCVWERVSAPARARVTLARGPEQHKAEVARVRQA
jgi:hypothetical protein